MKKKGYLFTLDVIIAVIIIIIGGIIVYSIMFYAPEKERTEILSNDVVGLLSDIKIYEVCQSTVYPCNCEYTSIEDLCSEIKNNQISLLEFLGQLYDDAIPRARIARIIDELLIQKKIIPANYDLEIILYNPDSKVSYQLYPDD
jgi:hypothetical protein